MGEAREVMDRFTEALTTGQDPAAVAALFAADAVVVVPDEGEIRGRDNIGEYFRQFTEAIPDGRYEPVYAWEVGNTAIDEGFFSGRNTGPLALPSGEKLPATQKQVRMRGCDFATVEGGLIVSYRLYFDQMEFLGQLGLLPDMPS